MTGGAKARCGKQVVAFVLTALLLLSACACGKTEPAPEPQNGTEQNSTTQNGTDPGNETGSGQENTGGNENDPTADSGNDDSGNGTVQQEINGSGQENTSGNGEEPSVGSGNGEVPGMPQTDPEAEKKAQQVVWGPGRNFNDDGRPRACVNLETWYGMYDADFVFLGDEHDGKVYLTFDEGYENGYTASILDTLKEKDVKAVFFVTMPYVKSNPELVRRMIDEGHTVGNHTNRHPNLTKVSEEDAIDNIMSLHDYVKENFHYTMTLFRPPEGAFSENTLALTQKLGYRSVFWSFAYVDWDPDKQPTIANAFPYVTDHVHDGQIFLLHAVSATNAAILGDVIDNVRAQGFVFEPYPQE